MRDLMIIAIAWMLVLSLYAALFVTVFTKKIFEWMTNRGIERKDAIYYNRKFVHIFAGGVITILVPLVFSSPIYPLLCGLLITIFTYISHRSSKMMYWFQTDDNLNDVNFCFMWGVSIFLLWTVLENVHGVQNASWIAIIPAAFMSFGDGITGIVRNMAFKKRTKHFIGNIYMGLLCIPLGYLLGWLGGIPLGGLIAAIVASFTERYEIGPLDDNILITISSSVFIYIYVLIVLV